MWATVFSAPVSAIRLVGKTQLDSEEPRAHHLKRKRTDLKTMCTLIVHQRSDTLSCRLVTEWTLTVAGSYDAELVLNGSSTARWSIEVRPSAAVFERTTVFLPEGSVEAGTAASFSFLLVDAYGNAVTDLEWVDLNGTVAEGPDLVSAPQFRYSLILIMCTLYAD